VVEDDSDTRQNLQVILEKDGWQVRTAENGRAALDLATTALPSLVLLDLMMPEMDGFVFLEEFRRLAGAAEVPAIVLTAKDLTPADRVRLNGYVSKIVQKGTSRDTLLREVRWLVAERVRRAKTTKASGGG
jgi:DNA-binding response OmpR family regulator